MEVLTQPGLPRSRVNGATIVSARDSLKSLQNTVLLKKKCQREYDANINMLLTHYVLICRKAINRD